MTEEKQQPSVVFNLEKVYTKDISYEAPNVPHMFMEQKPPEVGIELSIGHTALNAEQGVYEVVLSVIVTAKSEDKTAFLVEAQQAGVFRINGIPADDLPKALEIACPNILLPFVRQVINSLVENGGFPQLLLNPVNFDALYQQKQAAVRKEASH